MSTAVDPIAITRHFAASRALVFEQWTNPAHIREWFAPHGFEVIACRADARPGGRWTVTFVSTLGKIHYEEGEYLEVTRPERIVMTLSQRSDGGDAGPITLVTVQLTETEQGTMMAFEQTGYESLAMRDANAAGWAECLEKLEANLLLVRTHETGGSNASRPRS